MFVNGANVEIGGVACTNIVVDSQTQITCDSPAKATGPFVVVVTNADGGFSENPNVVAAGEVHSVSSWSCLACAETHTNPHLSHPNPT